MYKTDMEKLIKGRRFNAVIFDDMHEGEVSDEQMKKAVEWFKTTRRLLEEEKNCEKLHMHEDP